MLSVLRTAIAVMVERMEQLRRSKDRGLAEHGWLHSQHTFSFADYYDPKHMGFSVLRVINEDKIDPGTGFGQHGHRDMEIISYVIDGALEHRDSMGTVSVIRPGEIQRMSAGTGVQHSEKNLSRTEGTHFLQIWIQPDKRGYAPSYGQMNFEQKLSSSNFVLLASNDGREGSISLNQAVDLYVARSTEPTVIEHRTHSKRNVWIQVIRGQVQVNTNTLLPGDGLGLNEYDLVRLELGPATELLLFDLP